MTFSFAIPIKIKHSNKSSDCYNKTSVVYFSTSKLKRFTLSFFPFIQASNSLGSTTVQHTAVKTAHFIEESKSFLSSAGKYRQNNLVFVWKT